MMRMSKRLLIAVGAVGLWPALALASDMTSLATPMALLFVVAPLTLVHLSGTLVLAIKGLYRRAVVAWGHVLIASIAPVLGMAAAGSELSATRHAQDLIFALILLLGVLALSWLSMAIHRFQRPVGIGVYRHRGDTWR